MKRVMFSRRRAEVAAACEEWFLAVRDARAFDMIQLVARTMAAMVMDLR